MSATLLVAAHERIHSEALLMSVYILNTDASVMHTPSPPARSVDSPCWPPMPRVPSLLSGALYGFAFCAGVLWLEPPPMGASLVGRSHCETPVLIWT